MRSLARGRRQAPSSPSLLPSPEKEAAGAQRATAHWPSPSPGISDRPRAHLQGQVEPVRAPGARPVHAEGSALSQGRASCTSGAGVLVAASRAVSSTPCPRTEETGEMLDAGWRLLAGDHWPGPWLSSPFTHSRQPRCCQEGLTHPHMPALHRGKAWHSAGAALLPNHKPPWDPLQEVAQDPAGGGGLPSLHGGVRAGTCPRTPSTDSSRRKLMPPWLR